LGCSWSPREASWGALGVLLGPFSLLRALLGSSWGALGAYRGAPEANFENLYGEEGALGALLGRSWSPKRSKTFKYTTLIMGFWFAGAKRHAGETTSHAISCSRALTESERNEEADEEKNDEPLGSFYGSDKPRSANFENLYGEEGAPGALLGCSWKPKRPKSSPNTTFIVEFGFSGTENTQAKRRAMRYLAREL
jgi:hypothetical protein